MIKSVFSKLFRLNSKTPPPPQPQNSCSDDNNRINIATISYFQSSSSSATPSSDIYYSNNNAADSGGSPSVSSSSSSTNDLNSASRDSFKSQQQQQQRQQDQYIYIAPSCIRYTNSLLNDTIIRINENDITEISKQILQSNNMPPKLQIVLNDGFYYSINNSSLQIYKQLEKLGIITHVQADIVPLNTIPSSIRENLLTHDESFDDSFDDSDLDNVSNYNSKENEILVDETYEFGECEKCGESDADEENDSKRQEMRQEDEEEAIEEEEQVAGVYYEPEPIAIANTIETQENQESDSLLLKI